MSVINSQVHWLSRLPSFFEEKKKNKESESESKRERGITNMTTKQRRKKQMNNSQSVNNTQSSLNKDVETVKSGTEILNGRRKKRRVPRWMRWISVLIFCMISLYFIGEGRYLFQKKIDCNSLQHELSSQEISNPILKQRIIFLERFADQLIYEMLFEPYSFVPSHHVHPLQNKTVTLISGSMFIVIGNNASKGEFVSTELESEKSESKRSFFINSGTPHVFWNGNPSNELRVRIEISPPLHFESFLRVMYGLAKDGKVNQVNAMPPTLHLSVILNQYRDHFYSASIPIFIQRLFFFILSPLGKLAGYMPCYEQYI